MTFSRRRFPGSAALELAGLPALAATPKKRGTLCYVVGHGRAADTLNPGIFDKSFAIAADYIPTCRNVRPGAGAVI